MASWMLHGMHPALYVKDVTGNPNKVPPNHAKNLPKFNGDPSCAISHILSYMRYASTFEERHEDLLVRSCLISLEWKQQKWIKCSCNPKSIPSFKIFVEEFLKHCGPKFQSFEDTYHELLTALEEEDLLDLFEGDKGIHKEEASAVLEKKEGSADTNKEEVTVQEEQYSNSPEQCLTKGCDADFSVQKEDHLAPFEDDDGVTEMKNTTDLQQRCPHGFPPESDYGKNGNAAIPASCKGVLNVVFEKITIQSSTDTRNVTVLKWDERQVCEDCNISISQHLGDVGVLVEEENSLDVVGSEKRCNSGPSDLFKPGCFLEQRNAKSYVLCFDAPPKYDYNHQRKERETIQADNDPGDKKGGSTNLKRSLKIYQTMTSSHDDTSSDLEEDFHLDLVHQNQSKSDVWITTGDSYDKTLGDLSTYDLCTDIFSGLERNGRNEALGFAGELISAQGRSHVLGHCLSFKRDKNNYRMCTKTRMDTCFQGPTSDWREIMEVFNFFLAVISKPMN